MNTSTISSCLRGFGRNLLPAALLAFAGSATHAATITWGAPTTIAGESDVRNDGTLLGAFSIGSSGNPTLNGVPFTSLSLTGTSVTSGNFNLSDTTFLGSTSGFGSTSAPFINLSSAYQTFLSAWGGNNGPTPIALTMNALVAGYSYEFEWWCNNSSSAGHNNTSAAAGNSVTLNSNAASAVGGLGQYSVGTFVADGTSQVVNFSIPSGGSIVNGFELRQTAVPEPSSALLAGSMLAASCGLRRRRGK